MMHGKWAVAAAILCAANAAPAQPWGIEARTPNSSLLITELPADNPGTMAVERVFPQLSFSQPVFLSSVPDDSNRLFVVEQDGIIRVFRNETDPATSDEFLNITNRVLNVGEQGLLGLAFDPDYADTGSPHAGEFYVYYSVSGGSRRSRISRFANVTPSGNSVDPGTEEVLIEFAQPASNHNGGTVLFGPDDMLYLGLGDGGGANDQFGNGQNTTTLLGDFIRIDVRSAPDEGLAYHIPQDNPFFNGGPAGTATRKEIYAWGVRNPYRFSFDMLTGLLYCADVGQDTYEEIDIIQSGNNYGWNIMEGLHCFSPETGCNQTGLTLPIVEYNHTQGNSVTGGYVYYGSRLPELYGNYVYGDFGSGRIWALRYDGSSVSGPDILVSDSGLSISSFGQDSSGEVYIVSYDGGIYRFVRSSPPPASSFPTRLSDIPALLTAGSGADQTTSGIFPYEPSAKLWSDGTRKERFIAIPGAGQIGYREGVGWDFPEETILIKNFSLPLDERDPDGSLKRIETRLLFRKDSAWHGFSYEWNEEETDALLLPGNKSRAFQITGEDGTSFSYSWYYPARTECNRCHTNAANRVLGLTTAQMNFDFNYPASGVTDNQLRTFDHIGLFTAALPGEPAALPRMPDPADAGEPLEDRARAYLAANCSFCHRPGGPAPVALDLRWETALGDMNALETRPQAGSLGISDPYIIASGDAMRSVLSARMGTLGADDRMPPLASSRVDEEGLVLINSWINSLPSPSAANQGWVLY
ncbi:PQQ-dependent sugar dehydrogenase [Candidatus Poribacteria bacterium]|nr:PQQ-dependent sugar dehydrogenase [Candidatus Poribacteria bacterium]